MKKEDIIKLINAKEIKQKYSWYEDGDYQIVGIRTQYEPFEMGQIEHLSKVWVDGEETEEELDGICAIRIDDIEEATGYPGNHVAVICGNRGYAGEDFGEIVIEDAVVVEILA